MESVRGYLLAVVCTALICGIVVRLLGGKGFSSSAGKLLAGLCMVLALVAPLTRFSLPSMEHFAAEMEWDAEQILADSKQKTKQAMEEIIIQRFQSYILEKVDDCDGELAVEVTLSDDDLPVPVAVKLSGNVSPYWRRVLTQMIEEDLGIAAEDQVWMLKG